MSYRQILVTDGPVRRRRFWADGRSAWRCSTSSGLRMKASVFGAFGALNDLVEIPIEAEHDAVVKSKRRDGHLHRAWRQLLDRPGRRANRSASRRRRSRVRLPAAWAGFRLRPRARTLSEGIVRRRRRAAHQDCRCGPGCTHRDRRRRRDPWRAAAPIPPQPVDAQGRPLSPWAGNRPSAWHRSAHGVLSCGRLASGRLLDCAPPFSAGGTRVSFNRGRVERKRDGIFAGLRPRFAQRLKRL